MFTSHDEISVVIMWLSTRFATLDQDRIRKIVLARTCFVNTKLGPILTKTNIINFMTKIGLRLGMLVNTTPGLDMPLYTLCGKSSQASHLTVHSIAPQSLHIFPQQTNIMP